MKNGNGKRVFGSDGRMVLGGNGRYPWVAFASAAPKVSDCASCGKDMDAHKPLQALACASK